MRTDRNILVLLRRPPYASADPLETVDVALVAGAFEQQVSVLFAGPGVWQLLNGQDGTALGTRTHGKVLAALPHHDVTRLYACADSLAAAGLAPADLVLPVETLSRAAQRALIEFQDVVITD